MANKGLTATARRLFELHGSGQYEAALRVAESAAADYPDDADRMTYWRACLLALVGEHERSLQTLEEGRDRGLWWAPEMLEFDPDLADIRSDARFGAIVEVSRTARAAAAEFPAKATVRRPDAEPATAILLVLHGRGEAADDIADWWSAPGAVVVAPRSTQVFGMRTGSWDDVERAEVDAGRAVRQASGTHPGLPLVVGGFSQGGGLALLLAAKAAVPGIAGFVVMGPSAGWAMEQLGDRPVRTPGLRGYVLVGDLDPRRELAARLAERLVASGADVHVEIIPGLGHAYPSDFAERLPEILRWTVADS